MGSYLYIDLILLAVTSSSDKSEVFVYLFFLLPYLGYVSSQDVWDAREIMIFWPISSVIGSRFSLAAVTIHLC